MTLHGRLWKMGPGAVCVLVLTGAQGQVKSLQVTEKDLRMAATYKVEPEYPAVARQIRLMGEVDLIVSVDPMGQVDKVVVLRGNTLLAGPSTQAVRKWKFNPFRADGQTARATGPVKFTFQM
ncbi:MAG: energy transducer TonB [Acidobacteriota bacterium]|nr:energy transducer TonB [Acidobacteriota bacterium]